jgi:hypothetical protein
MRKTVVLDFMNPAGTARRVLGWGWEAGFDKAGRRQTGTRQHGKNECMLQREDGTLLSDGSETPELNLRALFEEYHAQVEG